MRTVVPAAQRRHLHKARTLFGSGKSLPSHREAEQLAGSYPMFELTVDR